MPYHSGLIHADIVPSFKLILESAGTETDVSSSNIKPSLNFPELINEKRLVLVYGYEPPLQTGFSTTRSISFPMVDTKNPNVYEFYISKMKFIGESRVFTWHPKTGFLRID